LFSLYFKTNSSLFSNLSRLSLVISFLLLSFFFSLVLLNLQFILQKFSLFVLLSSPVFIGRRRDELPCLYPIQGRVAEASL
jgi:hypothetical protein